MSFIILNVCTTATIVFASTDIVESVFIDTYGKSLLEKYHPVCVCVITVTTERALIQSICSLGQTLTIHMT